ncbi:hypothetical protein CDAR_536521 [Caerostris darwini]|uniref:Uncharacterized protein n=1 Tax=Caerostris darwini TaxID=1538125 RepID=A0AAV4V190_9ARAC|nr:hypothetical protein CDAR_536521 [Caerostris darwini]
MKKIIEEEKIRNMDQKFFSDAARGGTSPPTPPQLMEKENLGDEGRTANKVRYRRNRRRRHLCAYISKCDFRCKALGYHISNSRSLIMLPIPQ